jgi:hypothetical protein
MDGLAVTISVTMRRKPVSRDEVRLDGSPQYTEIVTLPLDSVRERGDNLEPIRKLWAPLLRQLSRAKREWWASPRGVEHPEWSQKIGWWTGKALEPVGYPQPEGYRKCRHCRREFYRTKHYSGLYCSDRCQRLANAPRRTRWIARFIKARSEERASNRKHYCEHCDNPIDAKRSTMRFCSVKCRVAAHREHHQPMTDRA